MCFGKFFKKQFSILLDVIAIFESVRWFVSFLNSGIINLEINLQITDEHLNLQKIVYPFFLVSFIESASIISKNKFLYNTICSSIC